MDDLRAVRAALTVARLGSFAAASRVQNTSAASVTRLIAGLEQRLGLQLFVRTTRSVALTGAGATWVARITPVIAELDSITDELRQSEGAQSGLLRVTAPISFAQRVLPRLLADFANAYPDIDLTLTLSDRFEDMRHPDHDLAIRISDAPEDKSGVWRKIALMPRHLVASPTYLERFGPITQPNDLRRARCLSYSAEGQPENWVLQNGRATQRLRAGSEFIANNGDILCHLALAGLGIALLPDYIVAGALSDGRLKIVLPQWHPVALWLSLSYPPYEQLPHRVATFTGFFETHADIRALSADQASSRSSIMSPDSSRS